MKQILHITCSPKGNAAESYRLSQNIVDRLLVKDPTSVVMCRNLGAGTLGHLDENYAVSQHSLADVSQEGSAAISATLVKELESADVVVIGTSVHNFTVPSVLKAWIDHVVRVRWTFDVSAEGKIARLHDRPVFIAISSGGRFSSESARQPDFLTAYLRGIFSIIGLRNLTFVSVQGTVFGPEALEDARCKADEALLAHFASLAS